MKFPLRPLTFCVVVVCLALFAAQLALGGDEWRAVDPAELALKAPTVEKDADAEALFWEVRLDDSQMEEFSLRHYLRIKIFTERGKESQSKIDIPYLASEKIRD